MLLLIVWLAIVNVMETEVKLKDITNAILSKTDLHKLEHRSHYARSVFDSIHLQRIFLEITSSCSLKISFYTVHFLNTAYLF